VFTIRPATPGDRAGVEELILARSMWLEERGLETWRDAAGSVASLAGEPGGGMWIVQAGGEIIGTTTLQTQAPPEWTAEEAAQPALYLFTTATHPAWRHHRIGTQIAWWATDHAARHDVHWVRRGCYFPRLANHYQHQDYTLVRTTQRKTRTIYLLQHPAQQRNDLLLHEVQGVRS
jgi:GNAT superfamily N-acetyltransferase